MMSRPPMCLTTMSWLNTASPCGRVGPVWANWSRFVSETIFGLLGLVMFMMSTSGSSRSSTSTT